MRGPRGINALELLIVAAVVCAVVATGVPILRSGANAAVLDSNVQSLGAMVSERVIEGFSPVYRASGEGDPLEYLSTALEESLTGLEAALYVNPFLGRSEGTTVANVHVPSFPPQTAAPAVLITDWSGLLYRAVPDLSLSLRQRLAGTLVVAFDATGETIDVYFIDEEGKGSAACVSIPMGVTSVGA